MCVCGCCGGLALGGNGSTERAVMPTAKEVVARYDKALVKQVRHSGVHVEHPARHGGGAWGG